MRSGTIFKDRLKEQTFEIERLRNEIIVLQRNELYLEELAICAANALEDLKGPGWKRDLIAELRKAAQ